jgi:hypothetical protein
MIMYHGTDEEYAPFVMTQGFRLTHHWHGSGLGHGVYLSPLASFAAIWGKVIIACELKTGTRILWHAEADVKTLDHLKREFGKDILAPDFWKHVPRNKQLTRSELVALWSYLLSKHYLHNRPQGVDRRCLRELQRNYPRIFEHLKRHGFDAVGFKDPEWAEVLLINPSLAKAVSAHRYLWKGQFENGHLSEPIGPDALLRIRQAALASAQEDGWMQVEGKQKEQLVSSKSE